MQNKKPSVWVKPDFTGQHLKIHKEQLEKKPRRGTQEELESLSHIALNKYLSSGPLFSEESMLMSLPVYYDSDLTGLTDSL